MGLLANNIPIFLINIEEGFDIKRTEKAILEYLQSQNSTDSSIPKNSQIQNPYSIFQV